MVYGNSVREAVFTCRAYHIESEIDKDYAGELSYHNLFAYACRLTNLNLKVTKIYAVQNDTQIKFKTQVISYGREWGCKRPITAKRVPQRMQNRGLGGVIK